MSDSAYSKLKKCLIEKGIKVHEKHFYYKGESIMVNKNRTNPEDENNAKTFIRSLIKSINEN